MNDVKKLGAYIQVSQEVLDDAKSIWEVERRWREATPQQREQWHREAAERRAAERESTPQVPFAGFRLMERFGWSYDYATHLLQPYCTCGPDVDDGWYYCPHAVDLGFDQ